jgi:hypothetical protein
VIKKEREAHSERFWGKKEIQLASTVFRPQRILPRIGGLFAAVLLRRAGEATKDIRSTVECAVHLP